MDISLLTNMKKHLCLRDAALIFLIGLFHFSAPSNAADRYIKLDPSISKKCGVTFEHPNTWRFFIVDANDDETICLIAYRNSKEPQRVSGKGMLEGWREISDGSLEIKKIPLENRLLDFGFKKNKSGIVEYIGPESPESMKKMGYSADLPHDMSILEYDGYTLYVGHSQGTGIDVRSGKKYRTKRVDLLIGSQEKSIGTTDAESDRDTSTRGNIMVLERIYKSMRFVK